ncbi:MAG TPA: HWE histidine kinase domain-containing protein [Thermoleophilaceae bacterium]|nr:HWE histidine kinase domain-containing protein [Thermoleophilaceae bacterium]
MVLLAAVPVLAVQVYGELERREQRRREVAERVEQLAGLVAARLDRLIDGARVVLTTLGRFPAIEARDRAACADVLRRLAGEFPDLAVLAAATPAGEVFCTSTPQPPPTGLGVADRDYVQGALRTEAPVVSDLITGRVTGHKVLVVAQPILDTTGNVETVMTLSLAPERIARLLAEVPRPKGATIRVLDRASRVVAHVPHRPELVGEPADGALLRPEGPVARDDPAATPRLYGFAHPEDAPNLVAAVDVAPEAVFAEADRLFARQMAVTTAAFLLAALAAFGLGSSAIRRPVLRVRGAIDRIAGGDLSARAGADGGTIEELAALARGFDAMARQLEERDERLRVLMRELNHRIRNAFLLVQSIALRTLTQGAGREAFLGRLEALARISTLFAEGEEGTVDLRAVAEATLAPHRTDDGQLRLSGPEVALPAPVARTLSLVLHELATNAAKYGALSVPAGSVELAWRLETASDRRRLVIEWTERGGPAVRAPARRGFGRSLIERSVAYELGGEARLEFAPGGVRCRIELTLPGQRG